MRISFVGEEAAGWSLSIMPAIILNTSAAIKGEWVCSKFDLLHHTELIVNMNILGPSHGQESQC